MKDIIVGTAGHIDHGKTALVRALTGIDTDRLEEEKRRGISIDLGFAHLETGEVRFGFVDVPGHERFVKNMLAGAGGMDLVVLVVAADEGVKPQTREHFAICRLLGVRHGMIALTKKDLADGEMLELARAETAELVRGSFLEGAPVVAVSAVTGEGLDRLREELVRLAWRVPARDAAGIPRLPIDRSFTLRGFGTVVTGTLVEGRLRGGEEVEVQPGGRRLRIRGLQVYGRPVEEALAGQRTAVNLAGVEAGELHRGMTLTRPGVWEATGIVDVRQELLTGAPPLRHGTPVHFHAWTAETEAEVRLFSAAAPVEPGESGLARLLLREPVLLKPGDRFIVRRFSPLETIGGGVVIDTQPPLRMKKALAAARLAELEGAAIERRLALWAAEEPKGAVAARLAARAGLAPEQLPVLMAAAGLMLLRGDPVRVTTRERVLEEAMRLRERVEQFHHENPLLPGMPRASAGLDAGWLEAVLAADEEMVAEGDVLRLRRFTPVRQAEEAAAEERIERVFREAGLAAPAVREALERAGVDETKARTLLQLMIKDGRLVRVTPELIFHREAIARLRQELARRKGRRFSVGEFKEWTGVSRKYAIPLLEFLDRERVTRREGDRRVVV
ncbi:MAG: selenocysteine-specific translation elongation factor [Bryobacteraceae bacterium]|nr:MAG: selenocysteine-specific translation elongation factor [Bryobacteraceae bacterium]